MDSQAIILRLKKVLEYYSLTSSTFADSVDVQRSSISHLMSGRNKPSLDFVLKVVDKYPEVDLYWLLNGKGSFPKKEIIDAPTPIQQTSQNLFSNQEEEKIIEKTIIKKIEEKEPQSITDKNTSDNINLKENLNTRFSANGKKLIKVVLLYSDGSFEDFNP